MSNFPISGPKPTPTPDNASPVAKQDRTGAKITSAPRRTQDSARRKEGHKSIFSRIASPFKALRERIKSRAETRGISKEIRKNMPALKAKIAQELQNLRNKMKVKPQEISAAYTTDFSSFKRTFSNPFKDIFTDNEDMPVPSDFNIATAENNQEESASTHADNLIALCDGNKDQASTLSILLTSKAIDTVHQQLTKYSPKLRLRQETGQEKNRTDIRMMRNGTALVAITREVGSVNRANDTYTATIRTRFEVPRPPANTGSIGEGSDFPNPITLENVECKYVLRPPVVAL